MWAIGISFLMMGSVPYWIKRLDRKQEYPTVPTYKKMFHSGIWILILWVISLFLPEPYSIVLPLLPVIVLGLWMLKFIQNLMDQEETIKISKEKK